MRMKKVIAGVLASALAVTSVTFVSFAATGSDDTKKVLYDGDAIHVQPYISEGEGEDTVVILPGTYKVVSFSDQLLYDDLSNYENIAFTVTFDDEAIEYISNGNQWRAQSLFNLAWQANDKYDPSWPGLTITSDQDIGIDAYTSMPVAGKEYEVYYSTESFKAAIDAVEGFDFETMSNALIIKNGWTYVDITEISLIDPINTENPKTPLNVTINELEITFKENKGGSGDNVWDNWQAITAFTVEDFTAETLADFNVSTMTVEFVIADAVSGGEKFDWSTAGITYEINIFTGGSEWIVMGTSTFDPETNKVTITADVGNELKKWDSTLGFETFRIVAKMDKDKASAPTTLTIGKIATIDVESVTLDKENLSLSVGGDPVTLTATVLPADATYPTVTWKTDNAKVATVKNGVVTAVGAGETTITATAGKVSATCKVTVTAPVTGITLDQKTLSLTKGDTATLEATVEPTDATDKTVTWESSDTKVATVNNGVVTAVGGGKATITATAGDNISATCEVTVTVPVENITLEPESLELFTGKTATLTAKVTPTDATDKTVTWAIDDPEVATIEGKADGSCEVTAVGAGTATITAAAGGKPATCTVTVKDPAKKIILDDISVLTGKEQDISCTVDPKDAKISNITYKSSDETVFTVADGKVKGVSAGTATLTVMATNEVGTELKETCTVTVSDEAIVATAIELSATAVTLEVEGTETLTATLTPAGSTDSITWTSDNETVATVDKTGKTVKVTALKEGTATITAEVNDDVSATCTVTVTAKTIAITSVTLDPIAATVEEGKTVQLKATVNPESTTEDKTVTWNTSDDTIATVKDGLVTAVKEGKATITATAGTKSATCTITVTKKVIAIESVTLDKETASIEEGKTVQLTATVNPEDTTEDKTVTWSSSDEKVATVKDGLVTAVKEGNATITAKAGTKSAACKITVTAKVSEGEGNVDPDKGLVIEVDDEDITIEADSDTFEDTVTVVKAEVSVSEDVADEKTEEIADAVKDILDGEESTVEVSAVISITLTDQDGNDIQPVDGGVVKITVPYDGKSNYAAYIDGDVAEFIKLVIDEAKKYASFDAKHFSDYYLVALSDEAAEAIDKENGENEEPKPDEPKPEEPVTGTVLWEGSAAQGINWAWNPAEVAADKFVAAKVAAGDKITITYTIDNEASYHQLKIMDGSADHKILTSPKVNEYDTVDLTDGTSSYSFVLDQASAQSLTRADESDVERLKADGMTVMGYDVTIKSITLEKATEPTPPGSDTSEPEPIEPEPIEPPTSTTNYFTVPTVTNTPSEDSTTDTTSAPTPAESEQAAPSTTEEDTSTNTTSPYATADGGDDAQPTEAVSPAEAIPDDGNNGDVGNAGAGNAEDKNVATGVTLALIPMIAAAAGVVISKKRK